MLCHDIITACWRSVSQLQGTNLRSSMILWHYYCCEYTFSHDDNNALPSHISYSLVFTSSRFISCYSYFHLIFIYMEQNSYANIIIITQ